MMHHISSYSVFLLVWIVGISAQTNRVGRFKEVYAWKQLTYDFNGNLLINDRSAAIEDGENARDKRQSDSVRFQNDEEDRNSRSYRRPAQHNPYGQNGQRPQTQRPQNAQSSWNNNTTTTSRPADSDEASQFFIQYNNVPMGVERVGDRLFITVPRRRYGIPSTLNYITVSRNRQSRSPPLRPYPAPRAAAALVSVYRTRADTCGRLWMVDTGMMEIPNNMRQVQPPAIVVFDLHTNKQILRYEFKASDLPSNITARGLASITVDIMNNDCAGAYAYVVDLVTNGLIVYSLRDNDSWRLTHNYFNFDPNAGNLNVAGQTFQWNDGIFSITLSPPSGGCRTAYFHPMASNSEYSVSTCLLRNRTAAADSENWTQFNFLGERGQGSQSTMHGLHADTGVIFFAEIGRNAISCWNTASTLAPTNMAVVAQDSNRLVYPGDLHVVDDEVWVMTNNMPRFIYSRLDVNEYNFYIYRANVRELLSGTVCAQGLKLTASSDAVAFNNNF